MAKKDTPRVFLLVSIGFAVLGVGLLLGGWLVYRSTADFVQNALSAAGTVVNTHRSSSSQGEVSYYPVIQFRTRRGESVEFRSRSGSRSSEYNIGTQLTVLYDPVNPQQAEIGSFSALWLGTISLGVLGVGFTAVGLGGLVHFSREKSTSLRRAARLALVPLPFVFLGQISGQPATRAALTPVPKDYFAAPGTSLNIKPVLSEDDAYDAIIGSEGGTMIAEGPDLTVYTLTIPPGALVEPPEITMTPVKSAGGLPFARGLVAGVHLAPSGTWFMQPARLSIRPPQSLPAAEVTPFEYGGQGENMYLTPYRMEGDRVVVFLDHFSGAGFTLSTPQERAVQLARAPLGVREKLSQKTAQAIAELSRKPGSDQGNGIVDAIELTEEAYRREVLDPVRQQCAKNCTMGALYLELTLGVKRQRQLLTTTETPGNVKKLMALDAAYVEQCLKEQYEQCLRTGDFRGIQMWYMGYQRQLRIMSGNCSAADALEGKVNEYIRVAHNTRSNSTRPCSSQPS